MGIIKAAFASASTLAEDQWKEYFYCPAIPEDTIMVRSLKRTSERSANNGSDDVVTDGSIIAVADGEYAIVVSNGKLAAEYKESGAHTFVSGETTSVFHGGNLSSLGKEFGRRFSFGGDTPGVVQRVYYFNTKEMPGESFSGGNIPFRVLDENTGLDIDCMLSVSGYYTYHIANPIIIYKQLIGNIEHNYKAGTLLKMMSNEVKAVILSSCGSVSALGMRPSQIAQMLPEIEEKARQAANKKLYELRGIELVSFVITAFRVSGKDMAVIKDIQQTAVYKDPEMAKAALVKAQTGALTTAAGNSAGAMMGVAAVNAAATAAPVNKAPEAAPVKTTAAAPETAAPAKFCRECGTKLMGGKFCPGCGQKLE